MSNHSFNAISLKQLRRPPQWNRQFSSFYANSSNTQNNNNIQQNQSFINNSSISHQVYHNPVYNDSKLNYNQNFIPSTFSAEYQTEPQQLPIQRNNPNTPPQISNHRQGFVLPFNSVQPSFQDPHAPSYVTNNKSIFFDYEKNTYFVINHKKRVEEEEEDDNEENEVEQEESSLFSESNPQTMFQKPIEEPVRNIPTNNLHKPEGNIQPASLTKTIHATKRISKSNNVIFNHNRFIPTHPINQTPIFFQQPQPHRYQHHQIYNQSNNTFSYNLPTTNSHKYFDEYYNTNQRISTTNEVPSTESNNERQLENSPKKKSKKNLVGKRLYSTKRSFYKKSKSSFNLENSSFINNSSVKRSFSTSAIRKSESVEYNLDSEYENEKSFSQKNKISTDESIIPEPHGLSIDQLIAYGKKETRIGKILGINESNINILNNKEEIEEISKDDVQFVFSEFILNNSISIEEFETQLDTTIENFQPRIKDLWKRLLQCRRSVMISPEEVSAILFGTEESPNSTEDFVSYSLLKRNNIYFKLVQNDKFECRSIREVEEQSNLNETDKESIIKYKITLIEVVNKLLEDKKMKEERRTELDTIRLNCLKEMKLILKEKKNSDTSIESLDQNNLNHLSLSQPKYPYIIQNLKNHALDTLYQSEVKEIQENILKPLNLRFSSYGAFLLCRQLNLFDTDNVHLIRSSVPKTFSKEILEEASNLKKENLTDVDSHIRKDLSHLTIYAIDDKEKTAEVDDAISLIQLDNGEYEIYVHIADATRYIKYGSLIQEEANDRVATVYLPDTFIPMMPRDVSVDVMSLTETKENYTLTFKAKMKSNGDLCDYEIFPSKTSSLRWLDYDQVDEMFEEKREFDSEMSDTLKLMLSVANSRLEYRLKNGASSQSFFSSAVHTSKEDEIVVKPAKQFESYSRRIVQEFMIMANEISAVFSSNNDIVIPYRGTLGDIPSEPLPFDLDELKVDTSRSDEENLMKAISNYENSFLTNAACYTQVPCFHGGLGVKAYAQVTSPIRRYNDMLVHYQIKAKLRGDELPLDWEQIESILKHIDMKTRVINDLQKKSIKLWLYKYFEQNLKNEERNLYQSIVLKCENDNFNLVEQYKTEILLYKIGFTTTLYTTFKFEKGDKIQVKVDKVNWYDQTLHISIVDI